MLVYYRIYAENGAIFSKIPAATNDPFLGRIKVNSVPPPRTVKAVIRGIGKAENIDDRTSISLFLTVCSQSPLKDAVKVSTTILNGTGPGSTPQEPLALVAKMSDSERNGLESDGRGGLTTSLEFRYGTSIQHSPTFLFITSRLSGDSEVYYLLYVNGYEMPSKVAFDPEEPCLGRIRADSVAPPHTPASIKRCISRVERNPALTWHANLFADTSCDTPLKDGHISILRTDGPGLSPNEPMTIIQVDPSIPDGKYVIKNRAADIFWTAGTSSISLYTTTMQNAKGEITYGAQVRKHSPITRVFKG